MNTKYWTGILKGVARYNNRFGHTLAEVTCNNRSDFVAHIWGGGDTRHFPTRREANTWVEASV